MVPSIPAESSQISPHNGKLNTSHPHLTNHARPRRWSRIQSSGSKRGEKVRRNREEIRPRLDVEERNSANNPETEVSLDAESGQHESTVPVEPEPNGSQRRSSRSITATAECSVNQRRSSKTIKAPARYKDYL
ncbi:Hypothetical predicted protein [Paramuricea clavata]|uniref:Uncharacterized protein n=1 Tax=Paramuricea clavata TaxID=317549 RepID=A0A7D9IHL4_PARCT|nr:Hypothetical predicted protein [Paramuricea clavata]